MTHDEMNAWTARRAELFPNLRIPASSEAAILNDTSKLDYQTAMDALERYAAQKPYKGFWLDSWMRTYNGVREARRRTDSGQEAAAAAALEEDYRRAKAEQRQEIEDYQALPAAVREQAKRELHDIGYAPDDLDRAWRFIVLAWFRGDDVERYRIHRRPAHAVTQRAVRSIWEQIDDLRAMRASIDRQISALLDLMEADAA